MREFGEYKVIKKLGVGATSDVYLGLNTKGEKRALKVFNQFIPQSQGDVAFKRELENLRQLRNDKIVSVYGLEKNSEGKWVLIQEFVNGIGLNDVLKTNLSFVDRVAISLVVASEILYALEESHNKGIIHRDIKPENILLDSSGRIVLSDFGLSKNLNVPQGTLHGSLFGSPQYMSLKQFGGGEVTEEIDLYATCVLVYEIVSGKVPFEGENIEEIITAKKLGRFRPLDKANSYTPVKLAKIINETFKQGEGLIKYDRAYKLRFEFLNILDNLDIDLNKSIKRICSQRKMLTEDEEGRCVEVVLKDLEDSFDQSKDDFQKAFLLGRILKIDSSNKRGKFKKFKKSYFILLFLLTSLIGFGIHTTVTKSKKLQFASHSITKSVEKEDPNGNRQEVENKEIYAHKRVEVVQKEGYLIVNIPSDIKVFVDDKRIYQVGKKIPFTPGKYDISLIKEGYKTMSYEIEIKSEKDTVVKLD